MKLSRSISRPARMPRAIEACKRWRSLSLIPSSFRTHSSTSCPSGKVVGSSTKMRPLRTVVLITCIACEHSIRASAAQGAHAAASGVAGAAAAGAAKEQPAVARGVITGVVGRAAPRSLTTCCGSSPPARSRRRSSRRPTTATRSSTRSSGRPHGTRSVAPSASALRRAEALPQRSNLDAQAGATLPDQHERSVTRSATTAGAELVRFAGPVRPPRACPRRALCSRPARAPRGRQLPPHRRRVGDRAGPPRRVGATCRAVPGRRPAGAVERKLRAGR
jgi:hypothetical protein